eukprot:GHVP01031311.1.p1 GENE.GHVP01031311.1~~GHVP01031311.1.p1  ORF type:complete len:239 (+),score=26.26 GHVP01031311.1:24-719(+)
MPVQELFHSAPITYCDPNVGFLQDYLERTSSSVNSHEENVIDLYGPDPPSHGTTQQKATVNTQLIEPSSSFVSTSVTQVPEMSNEVLTELNNISENTSSIELKCTGEKWWDQMIQMTFKDYRGNEVCQITVEKKKLHRLKTEGLSTGKCDLNLESLCLLRDKGNLEVKNLLDPLLKFELSEAKYSYHIHDDNKCISWGHNLNHAEKRVRQYLREKQIVFVYPENYCPVDPH